MPPYHAAGGVAQSSLTLAPPAVKDMFNTILQQSLIPFRFDMVFRQFYTKAHQILSRVRVHRTGAPPSRAI